MIVQNCNLNNGSIVFKKYIYTLNIKVYNNSITYGTI